MLDAALHLAVDLEQPVIPLVPRAKNPLVRRGLRSASTNEATVRRWWQLWPDANIGLVMGRGLVALDIDGPTGKRSLAALEREHDKLPATVEAVTRRGRHIFFSVPDAVVVRPSAGRLGDGIDVRGDRSYVVAPPSIHPSGFVYRWKRGRAPGKHELAEAPAWLATLLRAVPGPARKDARAGAPPPGTARRVPADRSASGRDWHLALKMLREGAADDAIEDAIRRRTKRDESYVAFTVRNARLTHETNAMSAKVRGAKLEFLPARFGKSERTRVRLDLVTCDGEIIAASIVAPSRGYEGAAETWAACFPDIEPATLTAESWAAVRRAWEAIEWRGRSFLVATRAGSVVWIRSANPEIGRRALGAIAGSRPRRATGGTR